MGFSQGMLLGGALVAATVVLTGAARTGKFATIDVERINVREKDGTLRFVLAGRDSFPGAFDHGKEIDRPDRRHAAGMLFLNDEGTENGGLIWAGKRGQDGRINAGASLTFDRYGNDQTVQLLQTDSGTSDGSALIFSDRPGKPFDHAAIAAAAKLADPAARQKAMSDAGVGGAPRLYLGRSRDRNAVVMLQDQDGRPRLMLIVQPDGTAAIQFLDENGTPVRTISPKDEGK
ncbi:hypothetical protein [Novosphingobium sp.]|uniref:hypothetical protein n=1 Tax=Novosphingobium sp. TaxID=1874826 RepID=UPI0025FBD57F|nr:hypothetical protein [Novosphingobium sp.]MCC6926853.1 hypothetical protein [Novosphingobium sp.]